MRALRSQLGHGDRVRRRGTAARWPTGRTRPATARRADAPRARRGEWSGVRQSVLRLVVELDRVGDQHLGQQGGEGECGGTGSMIASGLWCRPCGWRRATRGRATRGRWSRSFGPAEGRPLGRPAPPGAVGEWPWASRAAGARADRLGPGRRAAGRDGEPHAPGGARDRGAPVTDAMWAPWGSTPSAGTGRKGWPFCGCPKRRRWRWVPATDRRPSSCGRRTSGPSWPATGAAGWPRVGHSWLERRRRGGTGPGRGPPRAGGGATGSPSDRLPTRRCGPRVGRSGDADPARERAPGGDRQRGPAPGASGRTWRWIASRRAGSTTPRSMRG